MTKDTLVSILIPSWDNFEYLSGALESLLSNQSTVGLMRIIVVNNGHKNSCDWIKHKQVEVIQTGGKNLGWEGGITEGLKHTTSEFVCFFNDDAFIPPCSRMWLNQLLQHFRFPKVAAVGPSSNVVMGLQNIFMKANAQVLAVKYLIGFCVVFRRKLFEEIGGMDMTLSGGDDLDWSIRLRDAGYKLLVDREVFVYHHGFKTGTRTMGDQNTAGGWNSYEMQERTNTALIKKHGLKKWYETVKGGVDLPEQTPASVHDVEGDMIRALIDPQDKVIYDLGCAGNKTLKRAIGIDFVKKGDIVETLDDNGNLVISQADIQADVSKELPVEDESADVICARHILEHMVDPLYVLGNWISKLKVGGRLIIAVPNREWISTIPMNSEHVISFTPASLQRMLTAFRLEILDVFASGNDVSFITVARRVE